MMVETFDVKPDPNVKEAKALLDRAFARANGFRPKVLQPDHDAKVKIFGRIEAFPTNKEFSFDNCFRSYPDQRCLIVKVVTICLSSELADSYGSVRLDIFRTDHFLEIEARGIIPRDVERLRGQICHNFGFRLVKETGHLNLLRIEVPHDWRC